MKGPRTFTRNSRWNVISIASQECRNEQEPRFVYIKPGVVEVHDIADPKFENPHGRKINHAVILKIVSTNICGSDQHMVRGRTTAKAGLVLGHEITGEVIEKGSDVEFIDIGDIVSVPFNVACGRCRNCREQNTGVCLTVNDSRPGGAYGYVDMGGWIGGQARFVMVPYADFNLLKFPDRDKALAKIRDLTMLTDILPTGFHGAITAKVGVGSIVYVAGAGPVGLAAAASARVLGAALVMIGDTNTKRLAHAKKVGFEPIDLNKSDKLGELVEAVVGEPVVDSFIDAVGFEAKGHDGKEQAAVVLKSGDGSYACCRLDRYSWPVRHRGSRLARQAGREGSVVIAVRSWLVEIAFVSHRPDAHAALQSSAHAGDLARPPAHRRHCQRAGHFAGRSAPYADFDKGAAVKFVLDPHGMVSKAA
jgi:glutathione-independent formaldehyde dehydrogenase